MRLLVLLAAWAIAQAAWAAPLIELRDLQGRVHRLSDYRGKVVLVNFWATWCGPCRKEMPSLERLRRSLGGRSFQIVAVNVDEPASRVRKFLRRVPLGAQVLLDPGGATTRAWKVQVLPASFLLDASGEVRFRHFGALDWSGPEARGRVLELLPHRAPGETTAKAFSPSG